VSYKNKQLMKRIMFKSFFKHHTKRVGISELMFGYIRVICHFGCDEFEEVKI